MKLAKRMNKIKPSPTLSITAKANELKAQGKNIVSFGAGEPDFDTPQNIKDAAVQAMKDGKTKYTPVPGTADMKDAVIAKLKKDNGVEYTREEIIICNGGKHALFNLFMAMVEDGDEVIVPSPYWVSYPDQINLFGGKTVTVETTDENGFKMTPQQLEAAITDRTIALVLNSPSNPTGSGYTKDELKALADVCVKKNVTIVSDEIYEHVVYDGFEHASVASFSPEVKANTIIVNGASKCYSMTGWRMGFAAGDKDLIKAMSKLQGQSTSNVSSITQAACVEAYNGSQEAVQEMLVAFKERRDYIVSALNAIDGISCYNPIGAFYVFPNISSVFGKTTPDGKTIESSQDFCLHLLEDHLVAAVHGSAFGAEGYMRMSYATSMEVIKEGISRISKAVSELK
jgi:aspartate aminotransferase